MAKDSYDVSKPRLGQFSKKRDKSFTSCVCTLLVLLGICVFLLLLTQAIRSKGKNVNEYKGRNTSTLNKTGKLQDVESEMELLEKYVQIMTTFKEGLGGEETTTMFSKISDDVLVDNVITESKNQELLRIQETTSINNNVVSTTERTTDTDETTTKRVDNFQELFGETHSIFTTINHDESVLQERRTTSYPNELINESEMGTSTVSDESHVITTKSSLNLNSLLFKDINTCNTTNCDFAAARIMLSMDFSKAPCENFYDFTCGGVFIDEKPELNTFDSTFLSDDNAAEFVKKFNAFYRSCLSHEDRFHYTKRIAKAKNLLQTVGSFQFNGESNETDNISEFIANLVLFNAMPLFEVGIDINPNTSSYILKLSKPDRTTLDAENWSTFSKIKKKCIREIEELSMIGSYSNLTVLYDSYRKCRRNYSDYLDSIETSMKELGVFFNFTEKEIFELMRDIKVFLEFEILPLIDEIEEPPEQLEYVAKKQYENMNLEDLEKKFPLIEWDKFFINISNENINSQTVIQISNWNYFEIVFSRLPQLDRGKLNNAFLAILATSLFENTVLPSHRHSRREFCRKRSQQLMPDIVNYFYKTLVPSDEIQEQHKYMLELYEKLRKRFNESLHDVEWLNNESRESMIKKLESINLVLLNTDDVMSEKLILEDDYSSLSFEYDDFQQNIFKLMEFRRRKLFSMQGKNVTHENLYRYFVDASKDEPVFFYANDVACIPYGLIKKIKKDLPGYITMAQVGFPLAKIIGHAFDSIGIKYRTNLSENAHVAYSNFADQTRDMIVLSNPIMFENREYFFDLTKALSENERIAENTALRLLTESFNTFGHHSLLPWISFQFSREKIFFLSIAQGLCKKTSLMEFVIEAHESSILPPQLRIENILGNSGEFLDQFKCRPGSAMTRIEDRLQFPYLTEASKEDIDY